MYTVLLFFKFVGQATVFQNSTLTIIIPNLYLHMPWSFKLKCHHNFTVLWMSLWTLALVTIGSSTLSISIKGSFNLLSFLYWLSVYNTVYDPLHDSEHKYVPYSVAIQQLQLPATAWYLMSLKLGITLQLIDSMHNNLACLISYTFLY